MLKSLLRVTMEMGGGARKGGGRKTKHELGRVGALQQWSCMLHAPGTPNAKASPMWLASVCRVVGIGTNRGLRKEREDVSVPF